MLSPKSSVRGGGRDMRINLGFDCSTEGRLEMLGFSFLCFFIMQWMDLIII